MDMNNILVPCTYKGRELVSIQACELCKNYNNCDIYAMLLDDDCEESP